ncbi:hypothetical protein [Dyadobacter sp. CY347]|nr:hypothetical protein [Dyadobacter sp. CY347]MCF2486612.1 hypothetical protein [Dyadobacter sp. CY347]
MKKEVKTASPFYKSEKERAAVEAFSQKKLQQAMKSLENVDLSIITGKKA